MALKFLCTDASLLFIRNVGDLMTIPVIWDSEGDEIPEGIS
ncbi:hypothetical protein ACNKHR_18040 [Shigella flexneri]